VNLIKYALKGHLPLNKEARQEMIAGLVSTSTLTCASLVSLVSFVMIVPTRNTLFSQKLKVVLSAHPVITALRAPLPRPLLNAPRVLKDLILALGVRLIVMYVLKAQLPARKLLQSVSFVVLDLPIIKNCRLALAKAFSAPGRNQPIHASVCLDTKPQYPPQKSQVRLYSLTASPYWHPAAQPRPVSSMSLTSALLSITVTRTTSVPLTASSTKPLTHASVTTSQTISTIIVINNANSLQ
jgi:hypothetical protein